MARHAELTERRWHGADEVVRGLCQTHEGRDDPCHVPQATAVRLGGTPCHLSHVPCPPPAVCRLWPPWDPGQPHHGPPGPAGGTRGRQGSRQLPAPVPP